MFADLAAEAMVFEANLFRFVRGGGRSGEGGSLRAGEVAHVASFGGFSSAPTDVNTIVYVTQLVNTELGKCVKGNEVRDWERL
jgi:hypothetical protein